MVSKEDMKKLEMSYPLKINRILRGAFIAPCPDCKSFLTEDAVDCDEWCLKKCVHMIDREILSDRQKQIHNERRLDNLNSAIRALAILKENCDISDEEYRKRMDEISEQMKK